MNLFDPLSASLNHIKIMKQIKEDNRLLASLAVFRELYNSEKDVYGIISVFLADIIKNENLYSFNLSEITAKLNSVFEFEIPEAVVRTSLGRLSFLEKQQGVYLVTDISNINTETFVGSIIFAYYIILVGAIFYFTWDRMEQYTFIFSIVPIILSFLYLLITEQTLSPIKYLQIQQKKYFSQTYEEFNFDLQKVADNDEEISQLRIEIDRINNSRKN